MWSRLLVLACALLLLPAPALSTQALAGAAKTVAQTGASREEGLRRLDAIEQSYAPVFAEFQRAEVVQNALASGLDQALVAAHNGTQQNMGSLLKLYTELHSMSNALADTIGTAGGDP